MTVSYTHLDVYKRQDTLRLYEMFMGPLEVSKPWNDSNVQGAKRFITRVWNFFTEPENIIEEDEMCIRDRCSGLLRKHL